MMGFLRFFRIIIASFLLFFQLMDERNEANDNTDYSYEKTDELIVLFCERYDSIHHIVFLFPAVDIDLSIKCLCLIICRRQ